MNPAYQQEAVARIERERIEVRLSHAKLCERAGIDPSTWWRNRNFPDTITIDTIDKLETAIRAKRAEALAA